MNYDEIINKLGPCGLSCEKCFSYVNGNIKFHSMELAKFLGSFDRYAERFVTMLDEPVFEKYPDFKEMLDYFTKVECLGCRQEECKLFKNCNVKECSKNMRVDFCFECDKFPCNETGFDEHLRKRWLNINNRMKEIGIENYYEEIKELPRY
jgi:hypothetical protein